MIKRAKSLVLSDFRAFPASRTIPLDGDVVLVYSPNGGGKTSILSAIEFAVTGVVADLNRFEADYPHCLTNVDCPGPGRAALAFEDDLGKECVQSSMVGQLESSTGPLSADAKTFFADRCYLSQARLSRLLDLYQERSGRKADQPLIRFVKELLDLGPLDNLVQGLYVAGRSDRVRNSVPAVATLLTSIDSTRRQVEALQAPNDADRAWKAVSVGIPSLAVEVGLPAAVPHDLTSLDALIAQVRAERDAGLARQEQLRDWRSKAAAIAGHSTLQSYADRSDISESSETLAQEEARAVETLRQRLALAESDLSTLGVSLGDNVRENIVVHFEFMAAFVGAAVERVEAAAQAADETARRVSAMKADLAKVQSELDTLADGKTVIAGPMSGLIAALRAISDHVKSDSCPVCNRDFGELGRGSLREHLSAELVRLGQQLDDIQRELARRSGLEAKRDELVRTLKATVQRLDTSKTVGESGAVAAEMRGIAQRVEDVRPVADRIRALRSRLTTAQALLREEKALAEQHERRRAIVSEVARGLRKPVDTGLDDSTSLAILLSHLSDELTRESSKLEKLDELRGSLEELRRAQIARTEQLNTLDQLKSRLTTLESRNEAVERIVDRARRLEALATEVTSQMLSAVFSQELNDLWKALFGRLARSERFRPAFNEPEISYGSVKACIRAETGGEIGFDNLGAAMSAGNLNTAALSLFLALHLIERPKMGLLVLDDPVQNMDDIHVVQLAALFRRLAYEESARRQLVVAVHERALFEYLVNELAPSQAGDSMITIEIDVGPAHQREVRHSVHFWQPDQLRFVG